MDQWYGSPYNTCGFNLTPLTLHMDRSSYKNRQWAQVIVNRTNAIIQYFLGLKACSQCCSLQQGIIDIDSYHWRVYNCTEGLEQYRIKIHTLPWWSNLEHKRRVPSMYLWYDDRGCYVTTLIQSIRNWTLCSMRAWVVSPWISIAQRRLELCKCHVCVIIICCQIKMNHVFSVTAALWPIPICTLQCSGWPPVVMVRLTQAAQSYKHITSNVKL